MNFRGTGRGICFFEFAPFGHESSLPGPELSRRQSAFGPNVHVQLTWFGPVLPQIWPARLTDCPASESDSAGHSAAAFERAGKPGCPPVPDDTCRLRLTPIDSVMGGEAGSDPARGPG